MIRSFRRALGRYLLQWLLKDIKARAYIALQESRKPLSSDQHTTNDLHRFLAADAWYYGLVHITEDY